MFPWYIQTNFKFNGNWIQWKVPTKFLLMHGIDQIGFYNDGEQNRETGQNDQIESE